MKHVDLILKNALILTMDDDFTIFNPGSVAITGKDIIAVGNEVHGEAICGCHGGSFRKGIGGGADALSHPGLGIRTHMAKS